MIYEKYKALYPPRPKNAVPKDELEYYEERGNFMAQPKLNGSNCVIHMNETNTIIRNRHKDILNNFKIPKEELRKLYSGKGWMILNGEVLNKNQDNSFGEFNHKLVLFDILVYNSVHLIGSTFEERIGLIYELYGENTFEKDENLNQITENIFSVKTFTENFTKKFEEIIPIPVYEGLVLKRANAKLQNGTSENNNHTSQVKCRKETKNYRF